MGGSTGSPVSGVATALPSRPPTHHPPGPQGTGWALQMQPEHQHGDIWGPPRLPRAWGTDWSGGQRSRGQRRAELTGCGTRQPKERVDRHWWPMRPMPLRIGVGGRSPVISRKRSFKKRGHGGRKGLVSWLLRPIPGLSHPAPRWHQGS